MWPTAARSPYGNSLLQLCRLISRAAQAELAVLEPRSGTLIGTVAFGRSFRYGSR